MLILVDFYKTYEISNLSKSIVSLWMPNICKLNKNEHKFPRNKGDTGEDVVWFTRSASRSRAANGYKFEKTLEPSLCIKSQSFRMAIRSEGVRMEFWKYTCKKLISKRKTTTFLLALLIWPHRQLMNKLNWWVHCIPKFTFKTKIGN